MDYLLFTLLIGIGATAVMDLWAIVRRVLFGLALPNYGLVGRWFGHMAHGRFRHHPIAASAPIHGEHIIGWTAHYLTGIGFAALLIAACGRAWMQQPTLAPALAIGLATVVAPFLLMQPGMGAGIAASRTPHPATARLHSLVTHAIFGVGLFVSGWVLHLVWP